MDTMTENSNENANLTSNHNISEIAKLSQQLRHQGNFLQLKEARLQLLKQEESLERKRALQKIDEEMAKLSDKIKSSYNIAQNASTSNDISQNDEEMSWDYSTYKPEKRGKACSVPGCNANIYKNPNLIWFDFPTDIKQKLLWLKLIKCHPAQIKENSVICASHFKSEDILSLKKGILAPNALPSILPKNHLTNEISNENGILEEIEDSDMANEENTFDANDVISDYDNIIHDFHSKLSFHLSFWKVNFDAPLVFYKMDTEFCPVITVSIKIEPSLKVHVYKREMEVDQDYLKFLLGPKCILTKWSQLKSLLNYYNENSEYAYLSIEDYIKNAQLNLKDCLKILSDNGDQMNELQLKLEFLSNQLGLLQNENFTSQSLEWAMSIYLNSSTCYREIFQNKCLTLPNENELLKLCII